MNEFEAVQKTMEKIFAVLNESKLSGMTIYYMLGDIQNMVKNQIQNCYIENQNQVTNDADNSEPNSK